MRASLFMIFLASAIAPSRAQEITVLDAKRDLSAARRALIKVVTFCKHCDESGKVDGKACAHCDGRGVTLKCEADRIEHRLELEQKAERLGAPRSKYAEFDVAHRLDEFQKEIEPESLKMLEAYVAYVKVFREYEEVLDKDQRFKPKAAKVIEQLDELIARHGARLRISSLKLLYEDDPVGKVGAFRLYGRRSKVRIDGKEVERVDLRTLDEYAVLIARDRAKARPGFTLAEIVGKKQYTTDEGKQIKAIFLQAY